MDIFNGRDTGTQKIIKSQLIKKRLTEIYIKWVFAIFCVPRVPCPISWLNCVFGVGIICAMLSHAHDIKPWNGTRKISVSLCVPMSRENVKCQDPQIRERKRFKKKPKGQAPRGFGRSRNKK